MKFNIIMEQYFSGEKLYGDDFSIEQIKEWYKCEEEAYADLYGITDSKDDYNHDLNLVHAYKYLPDRKFDSVLGLGSSWGYEFIPIIPKINKLNIIDSSIKTSSNKIDDIIPIYSKANIDGRIDFEDDSFDLITCISVLHHIPNVSYVVSELVRVLKPGGYLIIREPIVSMGDWRYKRKGVTSCERGIPYKIMRKILTNNEVEIIHESFFSIGVHRLYKYFKYYKCLHFLYLMYLYLDLLLSKMFLFNVHYKSNSIFDKLSPSSVSYVLYKRTNK
ncbi:class I SAM-dependent methyltransferase [uncultured Parabacteroides sp.]|uniref:class I SAM-dependent methyltransferase n=1 Tax=uncultured Parabacteroides sp. TaxID=512312 RepID=UPI0025942718|nr:class I SAM-dependent methyltransferase [uncultured Parabacteroides sp.]